MMIWVKDKETRRIFISLKEIYENGSSGWARKALFELYWVFKKIDTYDLFRVFQNNRYDSVI